MSPSESIIIIAIYSSIFCSL